MGIFFRFNLRISALLVEDFMELQTRIDALKSSDIFAYPEMGYRKSQLSTQEILKNPILPRDTAQVKDLLRKIGEPATIFGEKDPERRLRLKQLIIGLTDA